MESVIASIESPRHDFGKIIDEYDECHKSCRAKMASFTESTSKYQKLQEALYALLVEGDDIWDKVVEADKGSDSQKKQVEKLRGALKRMDENLKTQANAIGDIETSVDRATRSFKNLMKTMEGVKTQHQNVRTSIDQRVRAMVSLVPEIKKSSTTQSTSSRTAKR
jgi:methyl-accepting chemotaxis protein